MCILLCRTLPGIELDRIASGLAIIPVRCGRQTQHQGGRVARHPNHYFAPTSAFGRSVSVMMGKSRHSRSRRRGFGGRRTTQPQEHQN